MTNTLNIPLVSDDALSLPLTTGTPLFIVGPNGSGKSALIQHAVTALGVANVKRIAAHRQLWMESGSINMTARSRREFGSNQMQWERSPNYRWMEHDQLSRLTSVLFDLIAKENARARRVTERVDAQQPGAATKLANEVKSPFTQINNLLKSAGLSVTIECPDDEEIVAKQRDTEGTYSIAKMSDGERSAVLMAAEVLTVESGKTLLIDEPERHLHRSIIEPLLSALFNQRPDCAFVVSTHEIGLPISHPGSKSLSTIFLGLTP